MIGKKITCSSNHKHSDHPIKERAQNALGMGGKIGAIILFTQTIV
jgi:hypothetical protein